jgi:hypothetical protein
VQECYKLSLLEWFSIKSEQTFAAIRYAAASMHAGRDLAPKFVKEIEEEGSLLGGIIGAEEQLFELLPTAEGPSAP